MCLLGVEPSFPSIVASGKNGATPHHVPTAAKLSGFVVLDFGIIYRNYCSDITRTVFVGNPSSADRKTYERLLKVQEECIKKVVPGAKFEQIDAFAHKKVGTAMIHRVGHSLGIDVHDVQPRPWTLQAGNIVTIEPGTYHKGKFGIRIEDDILVSNNGSTILTRASKELRVIR
jgi:Xaa-Pro aminopeptidase